MTMGQATTDAHGDTPRHRPLGSPIRFPVRVRLTIVTCALAALALAGAGLAVYLIETDRLGEQANAAVEQELGEFAKAQGRGDPTTGEPFRDSESLFRFFLERNVPDDDELLVGWVNGAPELRSPASDLTSDEDFLNAVRRHLGDGGSAFIDSSTYGEVLVSVQPVVSERGAAATDALVVATFMDVTRADLRSTMRTYTLVSMLALALLAALAFWQAGRLLAPLRTLRATAADITTRDLSRRLPVRGNDDITALTVTFNDMLERLDAGVQAQRRFLDDAGHELKTPLTVLRGHLELLDVGNPAELTETKELLLDEVDRMSRLVQDLILLTKSRRPDFLEARAVDLEGLTRALFAKARGLGERAWTLESIGTGTVVVDEQRITQAVLQLADNAVKHTDPGARIALGSSYGAGAVRIWVHDAGSGIPESDRERIFERFARAETRSGDEGFGLGLSLVRAIAETHGGTVAVDPGGMVSAGARLVITLPAERQD